MRHYKITEKGHLVEAMSQDDPKGWFILSSKEFAQHYERFGISEKRMQACDWQAQVSRIEIYQKYDFGLLHSITQIGDAFVKEPFYFYLSKDYLLFIVQSDITFLGEFEKGLIEEQEEVYTPSKILCLVIANITEQNAVLLDELEQKLGRLEEQVLDKEKVDVVAIVVKYRKALAFIKKNCEPIIDIVKDIEQNGNQIADEETTSYLTRLGHRVDRFNEQMIHISDYITQVRETYDSVVNSKMNEVSEMLALLTAIFLPITLINGWYGMNIKMPELEWEYTYIYIALFSGVGIFICIAIFKKMKWLN